MLALGGFIVSPIHGLDLVACWPNKFIFKQDTVFVLGTHPNKALEKTNLDVIALYPEAHHSVSLSAAFSMALKVNYKA